MYLCIYVSTYLPSYLSLCLSVCLSVCLPVCLSTCLSASLKTKLFCETSSGFELDKIKNAAILRDFLNVWTWQRQKRSNSARLPQYLNLTTSKTKRFCETSSFLDVGNIRNERILRDFLQKWKVEFSADSLVPMRFAIFPLHLSKVLRLPRKIDARSYEVLHLSRKIILANLKIWCSKMQPPSGNQRPDLLTSLMNMSFVLRLPRKVHLCRSSSNVPRLPWFLEMLQNLHVLLTLTRCTIPCACHAKQHLNVQKWSEPSVFCTFWLGNVLRATTVCTFSSLIWPHGSAPAALASLLFDPPEPQIIWKTQCFATFLPFRASASSFFWLFLFSDLLSSTLLFSLPLPSSAFHLSILSEVWLLNFLRSFFYL